jgi:hypothetical protein
MKLGSGLCNQYPRRCVLGDDIVGPKPVVRINFLVLPSTLNPASA